MSDSKAVIETSKLSEEQLDLIKRTIAKGATTDELNLFLYQCKRLGLDPLSKQIYFVKYGNSAGTIITGIDGFRIVANRTGKLAGIKRGAMHDNSGRLTGAWAEVYRHDWIHPAREEVPFKEYDKGSGNWKSMPETMIKKVAEAAALRMAFPSDLSGIYSEDEMDQANRAPAPQPTSHPNDPGDYTPTFGKFKGHKLKTLPLDQLKGYIEWMQSNAAKDKKPMSHGAQEFVMAVDVFLDSATSMQKEIKAKAEEPDFGPPPHDDTDQIPF